MDEVVVFVGVLGELVCVGGCVLGCGCVDYGGCICVCGCGDCDGVGDQCVLGKVESYYFVLEGGCLVSVWLKL